MTIIRVAHARHFLKRNPARRQGVDLYPLLGLFLIALAAVLGYGALCFLIKA